MKLNLQQTDIFEDRHHGQTDAALADMLQTIGVKSIDELIGQTVPDAIRLAKPLNLPAPKSETAVSDGF